MNTADDLSSKKARFYLTLEVKLIAWAMVALTMGAALTLPSVALAFASLGGMLFILWLGMRDPFYVSLRSLATAAE
jgi:hypothetical protein